MNCLLCNRALPTYLTLSELILPFPLHRDCLCRQCRSQFIRYELAQHHCRGCGKVTTEIELCADCQAWQRQYGWLLVNQPLYHYNDAMTTYMTEYKFRGNYSLRTVFQSAVRTALSEIEYDVLVPVPVSKQTLLTRGFNQVIGLIEGQTYTEALTVTKQGKERQSAKNRHERLLTKQPFALQQAQSLVGQRVLLIDDVYTTGRTLYHAAVLCRQAGCQNVKSLSLAR